MDLLPPRWSDVSDEVNEILARISKHSATLEKLHQKHVLPGFDDNRNKEEEEIEFLTTEITAGFHTCQNKIRKIEKMAQGGSKAEMAMGRNIQVSLASKVQEASTKFRKKQSAYLKSARRRHGVGAAGLTLTGNRAPWFERACVAAAGLPVRVACCSG